MAARTRDLVALSFIFVAPLAAILVSQALPSPAVEPAPAPEEPAPAPVVVPAMPEPESPAPPPVEPAPEPVAEPAPEPPAPAPGRDPARAMLLHEDALVLHTHADAAWAAGRAAITAEPGHLLATRPVRWDRLPAPERDLAGAAVVVYDADGSACVADVGPARLHLERDGDIYDADTDYRPPTSKAALRAMVEKTLAETGDLLLLAGQRAAGGRPCRGLWARRADLPAPAVFGRRAADDAEEAAALELLRAQPEFAALAGEYAGHLAAMDAERRAGEPDWDAFVAANLAVTAWREIGGPRRVFSVELRLIDRAPCSDEFTGGLVVLLERRGERLVRLDQPAWTDLVALMDLDRDGVLEGVTRDGWETVLVGVDADGAETRDGFSIPYFGCPC